MSKLALKTVLVGGVLSAMALGTVPAVAAGNGTCSTRDKVIQALNEVYSEEPVSIGLTDAGAVIEVVASTEGTFTIVITHPNGLTCPIAAGKAWQAVGGMIKGEGT